MMHGRIAAFLIALALSGLVSAQLREFWAVDLLSGDLALVAGGGAPSGVVPVPGWGRQVRCDLSGRGVVVDAVVRGIHLVSATGSITTLSFAGDVLDAAPDGGGGAWVLQGVGSISWLCHVSVSSAVTDVLSFPGIARGLVPLPGGRLLIAWGASGAGVAALILVQSSPPAVLDELLLPGLPTEVVLDLEGRVLLPGLGLPYLPVVRVGPSLEVVDMIALPVPCERVRPVATNALAVLDEDLRTLRFVPPGTSPYETIVFDDVTALEELPSGTVLVTNSRSLWAYEVHSDGIRWQGAWRYGGPGSDGPGMQWAHARPDEDPDGDTFSTSEETAVGTDPASPLSAPFVAWRSGSLLHLEAQSASTLVYVVAAASGVVPGTSLLAPGPLLFQSLSPGMVFDRPTGFLDTGGADVEQVGPLPSGAFVACGAFDATTLAPVVSLPARPWNTL